MIKKGTMLYWCADDLRDSEVHRAVVHKDFKDSDKWLQAQLINERGQPSFLVGWKSEDRNQKWFTDEKDCQSHIEDRLNEFAEGLHEWEQETGQNEMTDDKLNDMEAEFNKTHGLSAFGVDVSKPVTKPMMESQKSVAHEKNIVQEQSRRALPDVEIAATDDMSLECE